MNLFAEYPTLLISSEWFWMILQITVILTFSIAVSYLWERRSSLAHCALLCGMLIALGTPLLSIGVRTLDVGIFRTSQSNAVAVDGQQKESEPMLSQRTGPIVRYSDFNLAADSQSERIVESPNLLVEDNLTFDKPMTEADPAPENETFVEKLPESRLNAENTPALPTSRRTVSPMTAGVVLLALWVAWSGWLFFRLMLGVWGSWRLRCQVRPLDNDTLIEKLHALSQTMKVKKTIALAESTAIDRPMIWCWGAPVIVLPSEYREVKQVEWSSVFAHELAHLQRRDHWWSLLGQVFVCILPWHPLVRWLVSRMSLLSERACDQVAIAGQANLPDSITRYAQSLVGFELAARDGYLKTKTSPIVLFAPFVTTRSGFVSRVQRLLSRRAVETPVGWLLRAAIIALPLVLLGCLLLRPGSSWHSMAMSAAGSDFVVADDDLFVELEPGVRLLGEINPFGELTGTYNWETDPSGKRIAFVGEKAIYLWDVEEQRVASSFELNDYFNWNTKLKWSNDGRRLAVAAIGNPNVGSEILLFDQDLKYLDSRILNASNFDDKLVDQKQADQFFSANRVNSLEFSSDNRILAFTTKGKFYIATLDPLNIVDSLAAPTQGNVETICFHNNRIYAFGFGSYVVDPNQSICSPLPEKLQILNSTRQCCLDREKNEIWAVGRQGFHVVNLNTGDSQPIEIPKNAFLSLPTLSPDKSLVAILVHLSGNSEKENNSCEVLIYDTVTRALRYRFRVFSIGIQNLEFSPGGKGIAVSVTGRPGIVHWELDAEQIEQSVEFKSLETTRSLGIDGEGKYVLSCGRVNASIIDWEKGNVVDSAKHLAIFPDQLPGSFLGVCQVNNEFELATFPKTGGSREVFTSYSIDFSTFNQTVNRILNLSLPENVFLVMPIGLAVDSQNSLLRVLVLDPNRGFRIQTFDVNTNKLRQNVFIRRPERSPFEPGLYSPGAISVDGTRVAVYESETVKVFDVAAKTVLYERSYSKPTAMIFGSDSSWLAVATDNEVIVLATETGEEIKRIEIRDPLVGYASEANQLVVTAATQGSPLTFYSTDDWSVDFEHTTSTANRTAIAITPNAKRLVLGLSDSRLEFWETEKIKR
jgi:WD40 repeat protein